MSLRYATVCSGIEAPSIAWRSLGWQPVFFSEIEAFPCRVLAERHPGVVAMAKSGVRRLTPRECERLQGFPDDYTAIPWRGRPAEECPDGPRYKAIGNSMATTVVRWIGERIEQVEAIAV